MNGRLEHSIRTNNNIKNILESMPYYMTEYYYSIISSTEPKTCEDYIRKIKKFLFFLNKDINKIDLMSITDTDVGRYMQNIQTKNIDNQRIPTSFSYQKCVWTALNSFFCYLDKKHYIASNPMNIIKRPNKEDEVKRNALNIDDINKIISQVNLGAGSKYAKSRQKKWIERDIAIFKLFICTGMRNAALSEINISDIDFDENIVKITDKRNKKHVYYLQDKLKESLMQWICKRNEILEYNNSTDALFISMQKKRMSEKSISNVIGKYSEEILGYKISPHKLRAVFGVTYYNASNGDIKATMDAMGHTSVITTQRYINNKNNARMESSVILNDLII